MDHRSSDAAARPPLRLISIAWGDSYLEDYLELCLPAALAPGNIPALLPHFSCEIVVVTESRFFERVRGHPSYAAAARLCPVRLVPVDDLVATRGSYGMSITYAFFRGFEDLGPRMTECTMLFLHADFIVADRSFAGLLPHLLRGERLIFSPSYCTIKENVKPLLQARRAEQGATLALDKRAMAGLILDNRHNTIRAKTVNQRFMRLPYMEQFYWAVNESVLLGHQLPIAVVAMKPERHLEMEDVNSLWDYGVIEEFCPSMKFTVLGDSDDFLLMELRERDTAKGELHLGWWPTPHSIAGNMHAFVTEYARLLGRPQLTLHSKDLPPDIDRHRKQLREFFDAVYAKLPKRLPTHLNHVQWTCHYAKFHDARRRFLLGLPQSDLAEAKLDYRGRRHRLPDPESVGLFSAVTSRVLGETGLHERREARALLEALTGGELAHAGAQGFVEPARPARLDASTRVALGELLRIAADRIYDRTGQVDQQTREQLDLEIVRRDRELAARAMRRKQLVRAMLDAAQGFEAWVEPEMPKKPNGKAAQLSRLFFGAAPRYRPWHWMWSPSRLAISAVEQHVTPSSRVLYLHQTTSLADVISKAGSIVSAPFWGALSAEDFYERLGKEPRFDCCVVEADLSEMPRLRRIFEMVRPLMVAPGHFTAFFVNVSNTALERDPEVVRDTFPACGPARIAYSGSAASLRAIALRSMVSKSLQSWLGFSAAHALALALTAPFALVSSILERGRTFENSYMAGRWVSAMTVDIEVG